MTDYKARLIRFYGKYAPDKLDSVDDLLEKSSGKEEKLFAKLVDKYGPEPSSPAPAGTRQASEPEHPTKATTVKPEPTSAATTTEVEENDYGTRPWWKARLVRFYAKYVPEKKPEEIDGLLDKAKDNPQQLLKLFSMLEQKYGPEPDPSSSEGEEEEEEEEEEDDDDKAAGEQEIPGLRTVQYCPVDGVPPEYSEYFETFPQALPWLAAHFPDLRLHTKKDAAIAEYAKAQGVEPLNEDEKVGKAEKAQARKRGGGATGKKGDGKIVVEMREQRKKAITTVKGLENVLDGTMKDAAKQLGKKFASGASVKTAPNGEEMIEIQGDWSYELPQVLLDFFPQIKKDMILTVDEDGKKQPAF